MDEQPVRRVRWVYGAFVAATVLLVLVTFLRDVSGGVTVFDERSVHTDLANRYAGTVWVPHLTAANTYHAAF